MVLVDTIAARHAVPLKGTWDVLVPQRVIDTGPDRAAVATTLYALRDGADIHALLLLQRNVLPAVGGWGPPAACDAEATLTVYRSVRDVLCGWARNVSFGSAEHRAQIGEIGQIGLGNNANQFGSPNDSWFWLGVRVSNRSDFLDVQLLLPNRPEIPQANTQEFLADMARSVDASWLSGHLTAVPLPPAAKPAPETPGSWWSGTLSLSAMRTATFRAAVSFKTFLVTVVMGANAATGGAIITILSVTNTGIYLMSDYVWERWRPLTPPPQDFARLVDAP